MVEHESFSVAIRLNVPESPESAGVTSAQYYEHLCDEIEKEMLALVDELSGRRIVESVVRTRALYPGPHAMTLADLLVVWSGHGPFGSVFSPRLGRFDGLEANLRSGDHRPGGWFDASGPRVSRLPTSIRVVDLAPIIAGPS